MPAGGPLAGGKVCAKRMAGEGAGRITGDADMKDRLDIIISALRELQLETMHIKSAKDELYWVDHYIENATMELRKAEKKLGGNK